jgi:hypothetical protein
VGVLQVKFETIRSYTGPNCALVRMTGTGRKGHRFARWRVDAEGHPTETFGNRKLAEEAFEVVAHLHIEREQRATLDGVSKRVSGTVIRRRR